MPGTPWARHDGRARSPIGGRWLLAPFGDRGGFIGLRFGVWSVSSVLQPAVLFNLVF